MNVPHHECYACIQRSIRIAEEWRHRAEHVSDIGMMDWWSNHKGDLERIFASTSPRSLCSSHANQR